MLCIIASHRIDAAPKNIPLFCKQEDRRGPTHKKRGLGKQKKKGDPSVSLNSRCLVHTRTGVVVCIPSPTTTESPFIRTATWVVDRGRTTVVREVVESWGLLIGTVPHTSTDPTTILARYYATVGLLPLPSTTAAVVAIAGVLGCVSSYYYYY